MLQELLDRMSDHPPTWNLLRRIVEDGFRGERAVIERELDPWRDLGQRRFLDFGCGTGEFANAFPSEAYVGMDLAARYVHYARQSQYGAFSVMDGTALGLEAASFDAAIVVGVFHHLSDALVRASVAELHRVLKPGGRLVVMEDIEPPPGSWNIAGRVMHLLDRGGYIRDDADYRALLEGGFTLVSDYQIRSGICDYSVYVLDREA